MMEIEKLNTQQKAFIRIAIHSLLKEENKMKSFKAFVTHKGKKHQNSFNFREDAENWVDMFKNADDFTYNIREYSLAEKLAEARKKALRK